VPADPVSGAARKTVVVELDSVQPVSLASPSAAMPPSRAHATATATRGAVRTVVAL